MLASFLTPYMRSFTLQAAWNVLASFHFSDTYFYWSIFMLLCTRRLFRQFSLGRKPSMHEFHLTFKPQTVCLKLYQIALFSLGTLRVWFAPLEVAVSAWQWICWKQSKSTSKEWRCHWAAAHSFLLGIAADPCFLQGIWNCSAKLDLAPIYLEMQNRLK